MSECRRPPRSEKPPITYRWNCVKRASVDLAEAQKLSRGNDEGRIKSEPTSAEILTTTELISAVGQIWNRVNSLSVFKPKTKMNHNDYVGQRKVLLGDLSGEEVSRLHTLDDDCKYFHADVKSHNHAAPMVQPTSEFLSVTQKMSVLKFCSKNYTHHPFFWQLLKQGNNLSNESWRGKGLSTVGIFCELEKIYGQMKELIPSGSQYAVDIYEIENKNNCKTCISGSTASDAEGCTSGDTTHPANNIASRTAECYFSPGEANPTNNEFRSSKNCSDSVTYRHASFDNGKTVTKTETTSSLYSNHVLGVLPDVNIHNSVTKAPSTSLCADYHAELLVPCKSTYEYVKGNNDDDKVDYNTRRQPEKFVAEEKTGIEICSSAPQKPHYAIARQGHAFAGAFAGIFVSLCLHPVDTIKTVIQSCRVEQKSIYHIGRSIVSERGATGLYRGIASNIASSAPISAIYTFTYESVKGYLLPLFPKEYHSLAHCIAGGCASIATSFVFTPSERIKQQMQIGSHYQNCWNALVGIIRKGGFPSLYAGWGAVLCRNVPHSIIKFYTYESLKQLMLLSQNSSDQPNTLQTLVCGGLATSTAALFTTPFDVVKTRLQTQIPGSMSQYDNVFHALKEIGRSEGLRGLYRGLMPRLVMYMSQGALFFASYELFKRLLTLDVQQREHRR